MAFRILTEFCTHHHDMILDDFHQLRMKPMPFKDHFVLHVVLCLASSTEYNVSRHIHVAAWMSTSFLFRAE